MSRESMKSVPTPIKQKPEQQHQAMSEEAFLGYRDCLARYKNAALNGATKNEKRDIAREAKRVADLLHLGLEKQQMLDIAGGKW